MTHGIALALLVVSVAATWLGAVGFARLWAPFDRLHAVAFVNAAGLLPLVFASLAADGASNRTAKIALAACAVLGGGAALSHALARMLAARESAYDSTR